MSKIIEIIKKKWLRETFLTILLIAIIFAIYFLINFVNEKLNLQDIDMTADKIYSISEATETKLKDLSKPVTIELINLGDYRYISDFADKYSNLNSNIVVEKVDDLSTRLDLVNKYNMELTDSLIRISSGERETILSVYDLFTYDYTTYEQIDLTEEKITNAIIEVTIENKPKIYFLEGHNQYGSSYFQVLKQDLESEALNILVKGNVPEDCKCLIITTLKEDLTEIERDKIIEYSNKGGKILLLADANVLNVNLTNFNQILDLYGFRISDGLLIEQDTSKMIYGAPEFIISEIEPYSAITGNSKMNLSVCVIDSAKINFKDEETLNSINVTYSPLARTSKSAFIRNNLYIQTFNKTEQDEDAPEAIVGALVTRNLENNNKAEMIVFSSSTFATNQQINITNDYAVYANRLCNNDDVVKNSVSYLTQRTDTITIRKDAESTTYNVTENEHGIIVAIIFIIPVVIIIIGIVVWQIRRRKK